MLDVSPLPRSTRRVAFLIWSFFILPALANAQTTISAVWDPNSSSDRVSSYEVCIGTSSLSCNIRLATVSASDTSYEFEPPAGQLVYVAVRAVNASGRSAYSAEQRFSIPALTALTNRSTLVSALITPINLSVSDPDGSRLTFTHTGLPPGVSINSSTGQITGTPSSEGSYNVTIFVSDALTTVSRSFVWTVTAAAAPDRTAPDLTITSHASGQVVTSASQTLRGTATDGGNGNSGISAVRINGQSASNGTASGSNSASWSRAITLVSGDNTISVEAVDGAGNIRMQQITLQLASSTSTGSSGSGTLAIAALTSNLTSPRPVGTPITFSAGASGGVAPQQFQFLVQQAGGATQVMQNWSTAKTYTWTPAVAGDYTVTVWARSAGVSANAAQASAQVTYSINASGVNAIAVSPSSGSGSTQTFALRFSDSRGAANLVSEWVWFAGGAGACMAYHDRATNLVHLINDAGTAWTSQVLGSNTTLQNSSCSIAVGSSSASAINSALTLNLAVTFKQAFNGAKTVKLFANAAGGQSSGWQDRGVWTVPTNVPTPAQNQTTQTPTPSPAQSVPPGVGALDVTPASGSGSTETFALRFSDSRGAASLVSEWVWFAGGTGACMAYHDRATNLVHLINDAGTAWTSQVLGSNTTLQNSSCSIAVGSSSASAVNSALTLNLAVTFKQAFNGAKTVKLFANAAGGQSSGWQDRGVWTVPTNVPTPAPAPTTPAPTPTPAQSVPPGVSALDVTPASGSGSTQTFTLRFSDSRGAANLVSEWVWFVGGTGACMAYHERATNLVYLINDAGTAWTSQVLGSNTTLQNSSCAINMRSSSASSSGSVVTLKLAVTFRSAFSGAKTIRGFANATGGLSSGWQDRGSWTVTRRN